MKKDCLVYTLRVANALVNRGFKIINTAINIDNPKYKVYYFEDSKAIREAIKEINASR